MMMKRIDDQCTRPVEFPYPSQRASTAPIFPTAAYFCANPAEADGLMSGEVDGYIYQRDGHPNGDLFAGMCREMHAAEEAIATSSGMAALALALLSKVQIGDHIVISNQMYGGSTRLFKQEATRLGIEVSEVDTMNESAVRSSCQRVTKLVVAETITNPQLRVVDINNLASIAHDHGALLLIDNTFATPAICQPLTLGADLVMESVTKMTNGHGDVTLGLLCGRHEAWERVPDVCSTWGFASSPFECWLAARGLSTLHVRMERAASNALRVAKYLDQHPKIKEVSYPGLESHPDHSLSKAQFVAHEGDRAGGEAGIPCGSIVTFTIPGDGQQTAVFIESISSKIPFCPSLGEIPTTLSHPASTSHRGLSVGEREELGIHEGTIRLSVGIQTPEYIISALEIALGGLD